MVMPRAFSSGAASIWSYALASPPNIFDSTVVIAAVRVVLPWSTCPIVPTFTCGLVRSNLLFAIFQNSEKTVTCLRCTWCPWRGSNARPLPYQGSALPLSHMGFPNRRQSGACPVDLQFEKGSAKIGETLVELERETGIEPASLAWKARVLPLNYSRSGSLAARPRTRKLEAKEQQFVVVEEAGFEPA